MFNKLKLMNLQSIAGLVVILVVFPLGAMYYMNMGAKWRKERLNELKDYSLLSEQQVLLAYDSRANVFLDEDNIIVTSFVNPDKRELTVLFGETLQKLHEQFDARGDVFFVTHVLRNSSEGEAFLQSFRETYALEDTVQCLFFLQDEKELEPLARQAYQVEREEGEDWLSNPYLGLVDSMVVRHYYDVRRPEAIHRLVEHIAILIPPKKEREDLIFKREKEK